VGCVGLIRNTGHITHSLSEVLGLIGGLACYVTPSDRVLLKPNLNGVDGCTDLSLTESLVRMLLDLRARPFIAESTFGGASTTDLFFQRTGYSDLAARYGIDLVNLNESEPVEILVKQPIATERIRIAKEVMETDRIINLPKMKVHYATGITLSLKNLKGFLVGSEKRRFHEIGLDDAIVDLNNTVHPTLSLVDAITGMERMGPRGGDIVNLDLVLAGQESGEVDYIGMSVMGFALSEVRHLRRYLERNAIDPERIEVRGEKVDAVRRPFKRVNLEAVLPPGFVVHEGDACSSCMNAFLLSCSFLDASPRGQFHVFMGSHRPEAPRAARIVAFGNCCPATGPFDIVVKGCPPFPHALRERLAESAGASGGM
jgi:uncharacterized protein (DUF362 family)